MKIELQKIMELEAEEAVQRMKDFFENKKDNEGYDILSFEEDENGKLIEKYIEVKSTKGPESTPIDITSNEVDFAKKHLDDYFIYRILNSDDTIKYSERSEEDLNTELKVAEDSEEYKITDKEDENG